MEAEVGFMVIGAGVVKLIENEIKQMGLAGIFLQTDSDKPAYEFYHKFGFKDLGEHVSLYKRVKE